ncbi:MAG: PD-(D/E)XK nuclease family protein [Campylobacteraceae bacterium]|nr:PD-(D/E)XK nuclease family protein [Campylobacteraceae bacterium]
MVISKNISKTLYVFQTSRRVQGFLAKNQNKLLSACSLADFIRKVAIVKDKTEASFLARLAILRSAAHKIDIGKLGFERSFLDFLSSSDFLFSFFEELRAEQKTIDDIRGKDIYAAYEDHLSVLEELFEEYSRELEAFGLYDFISVDDWHINSSYLQNFDEVVVESMGLFTSHELDILTKIAALIPLKLIFTIDKYNKKMVAKFASFGIEIGDTLGTATIDMSAKKLLSVKSRKQKDSNIVAYRLKNRAYEAPFAMSMISKLVKAGYRPENIAVILPDEGYAGILRLFDRHTNLNFAFGEPLIKTDMYAALKILLELASGEKVGTKAKIFDLEDICTPFLSLTQQQGAEAFIKAMELFLELNRWRSYKHEAAKKIFARALYELCAEAHLYKEAPSVEVGFLFALGVAKKKIDDIGGGQIKVMGVLESRGAELDAAIILDMNEEFFPKKLDKDLFLNTKIKERAGIPTSEDRQNLQKHYFAELIANTKECVFAFVENDEAAPSPFLYELGVNFIDVDEESLGEFYFSKISVQREEPIVFCTSKSLYEQYLEAKSKERLSVSAFCDFLKCDKFFYFKHIMALSKEKIEPKDETAQNIGSAIHKALETAFDPYAKRVFYDSSNLFDFIREESIKAIPEIEEQFDFVFSMRQMEKFCAEEIRRQKSGYRVYAVEKEIKGELHGVLFEGRIDRIDQDAEGKRLLIDYKISRSEIKADTQKSALDSYKYQLALYVALLSNADMQIDGAYYYDVLRGSLVGEKTLETKLSLLPAHIERFTATPTFAGTADKKNCRYCDFADICGVHSETTEEEGGDE